MKCTICNCLIENNELFCSECKEKEIFRDISRIASFDSLIRRANKMVEEFDRYPLMPQGDYSFNFIKKVIYNFCNEIKSFFLLPFSLLVF